MEHYLKVILTRSYGNGNSLTLEMHGSKPIPPDQNGIPEFDQALDKINGMFDHFTAEYLPTMHFSAPIIKQTVMQPAIEVCVKIEKGKRYIRVKTPEYSEFGLPWWPEDLKAAGISEKQIPEEGYTCKEGSMAELLVVDGKPKKVLRIIAAQSK